MSEKSYLNMESIVSAIRFDKDGTIGVYTAKDLDDEWTPTVMYSMAIAHLIAEGDSEFSSIVNRKIVEMTQRSEEESLH